MKLSGKLLMVVGALSIVLTLVTGWLVYLNMTQLSHTRASGNGDNGGNQLNRNSEIISEFTWEKDPVTHSTLGPDAISASSAAHAAPGGRSSTRGLAPGTNGKDIHLVIPSSPLFDQDGIDISIDYRRNESSGNFFSRGSSFNFGMNKGFITIAYRVDNKKGGYESVTASTDYEIPVDDVFRNYRFIYDPLNGKGEIFVNNIIVWSSSGSPLTSMYWKNAGNIIIGKEMNGGGKDIPVFDNLVIRSTGSLVPLAESLVNFMIESDGQGVKIHWSSAANDHADYFALQRSINGTDFTTIATIKANPNLADGDEYVYTDKPASSATIYYYRLRQNFRDGKFVVHPLSAIKLSVKKELSIERISPLPFNKSFDVSYFIPADGRVWIQLTDSKGKIRSSETYQVTQGKNVHVFRDQHNLESGTYTLNLIFGEQKVSSKVTKI